MDKYIDPKYLIKPGTKVLRPYEKGFCKHCTNCCKNDYCKASDNACDKVIACYAFFYKRKNES